MGYKIKLSELEKKLREVYKLGYGSTIKVYINGELYQLVEDKQLAEG